MTNGDKGERITEPDRAYHPPIEVLWSVWCQFGKKCKREGISRRRKINDWILRYLIQPEKTESKDAGIL